MKLLFLDLETTGLCNIYNAVIQIAGIIEELPKGIFDPKKAKVITDFNYTCSPFTEKLDFVLDNGKEDKKSYTVDKEIITEGSLEITGKTREEILSYQHPSKIYKSLLSTFRTNSSKEDKLIIVGANCKFDRTMLDTWFRKNGINYLHSYINWWFFDVQLLAFQLKILGKINPENLQISSLAEYFGIPLKAHDAFEDIKVTRKIFYILMDCISTAKEPNLKLEIPEIQSDLPIIL